MVLGFKKQFVAPILAGTKIHSIREDVNGRWKPGSIIHMATGTRSKYYNCFNETKCVSTQRIFMTYDWMLHISIGWDGPELYYPDKNILAINDGFKHFEAFEDWWAPLIMKSELQQFSGKIIHWTDLRY